MEEDTLQCAQVFMLPGQFKQLRGQFLLVHAVGLRPLDDQHRLLFARGAQAHALGGGRDFVSPVAVQDVAADVLAHRLVVSGDEVGHAFVAELIEKLPVPTT